MRNTKIIATIGPASCDPSMLKTLAESGVNIFRLNFSHGDYAWYGDLIQKIQALNDTLEIPVAIMLDTKGPEIRTAPLESPIQVEVGDHLTFTTQSGDYGSTGKLSVNYAGFGNDAEIGENILIDNGAMRLRVIDKSGNDVVCEALDAREIGSRRRINIPGKEVDMDSITEKDWEDIAFGVEQGIDFVALSFVRNGNDLKELKDYLRDQKADVEVLAKVESYEATQHLEDIVQASDGVMVARGDLGAEIPFAQVPQIQQELINLGARYRKPIIVATQMLESMIKDPMPTRAEVTDIAHAVYQEADCVMLSGETAAGIDPVRCVETMAEIAEVNEAYVSHFRIRDLEVSEDRDLFAKLGAAIPEDLGDISGIMVMTRTGWTAQVVSNFRPRVPIYAFVPDTVIARKNQLYWGLQSLVIDFESDPVKTVANAQKAFLSRFKDGKGKKYIVVTDDLAGDEMIPTLQIRSW